MGFKQVLSCIFVVIAYTTAENFNDIKGPPVAKEKDLKHIARKGDDIKIHCPITGKPEPIIEWYKGDEKIDFTWMRLKAARGNLKIRKAEVQDTGVYYCRGVNGFGTAQIQVDLIVIDPAEFPGLKDGELPDLSVPTFTPDTLTARQYYSKQTGESIKLQCEVRGNPKPDVYWFKDGIPFDADGIKYRNGKSVLRLRNLMQVDSAVYRCEARNIIGVASLNYTLNVEVPIAEQPAVLGQGNVSVMVGDTASLQCRVSALSPPHIKWLKRESAAAMTADEMLMSNSEYTISVGEDRYRVIHTGEDIPISRGEYLNKLVIVNAQEHHSGLYICFVTNSAGSFNYKPTYLRVYPANTLIPTGNGPTAAGENTHILALAVSLGILVLIFLIILILAVIKKSGLGGNGKNGGMRRVESGAEVRSLMPSSQSIQSNATIMTVASNKLEPPPLPPPPSMWGVTPGGTLKSNIIIAGPAGLEYSKECRSMGGSKTPDYHTSLHENSATMLLSNSDRDSPSQCSGGNTYEVPYCYSVHTLNSMHHPTTPAPMILQHPHANTMDGHSVLTASSTGKLNTSASSTDTRYPFRQYPYFKYLGDYEAYLD